jgi:hypothetical protein
MKRIQQSSSEPIKRGSPENTYRKPYVALIKNLESHQYHVLVNFFLHPAPRWTMLKSTMHVKTLKLYIFQGEIPNHKSAK